MTQLTAFGPDFPFDYQAWISHPAGTGAVPKAMHGTPVAVIGAGAAGVIAGFELMKLGLRPVLYESAQFGGRLRSQTFEGSDGIVAELGGMRFPISSRGFYHYLDLTGCQTKPFPNPLTPAAGSTVIDLEGRSHFARAPEDLPPIYRDIARAYDQALAEQADFAELQAAVRDKDVARIKALWDPLVATWDERTFYDFVAHSRAFQALDFHHREIFGQVGFGTGGWDSDFPNSMLEILRVNLLGLDDAQRFVVGGVEQVLHKLWRLAVNCTHWPEGTTLESLNAGATRSRATALSRAGDLIRVRDQWGNEDDYAAVLATCQSHLLTTAIDVEEELFDQKIWMALDRTRYMQSSKTFVMVDRPFWKDIDSRTNRPALSMTLTDRLTRGTYLFDNGDDQPGVICLSYAWMTDALKVLPLSDEKRVELALNALRKIYPDVDIAAHIRGAPICVSWEADQNFLGAFKGALPGHYRYNHRIYGHFMQQGFNDREKGIFLAGDGISWTPAWVEGAVQTALNAVWGIMAHLGGASAAGNPGPGDVYPERAPVPLPE
ncbi:flavin monoamine oxidase family protein [Actibacterium ureilyticum]|uniref:flavin monoamine oxidase family protein n=1 Tax=Actibacterium ureilyticum TaxID=1590614 RepID=UPI000BAADD9C|nr:NAD(P)/FAD-dependent oxidoreductase [Actibacterium ureilyticum]